MTSLIGTPALVNPHRQPACRAAGTEA